MKTLLLTAAAALTLLLLLGVFATFSRQPPMPAAGTLSHALLELGPLRVATETMELVDPSRFITHPDALDEQSPRSMSVRLWFPRSPTPKPQPLLIYSHGFMSTGEGVSYIAEVLASQGYVVAAPDFPITGRNQGDRARSRDVLNQPRDVELLIDRLLARSLDETDVLHGWIDSQRIAAVGYSLGALNTLLLGFHPSMQEPRIRAVISLAGPTEVFTRKFLNTRAIPFMAIAASQDSFVEYESNFLSLPDKVDDAILVSIEGGSHLGFADEGKWFRWFDHPDTVGCAFAKKTIAKNRKSTEPWYDELGGIEAGYVTMIDPGVCEAEFSSGINPLRQQQLTLMAVRSFLACQFDSLPADRAHWCGYLQGAFAKENPEVTILLPH